jgi:2-methylisocitrate lyase-like PEP mutase family enzyme
VYEIKKRNAVNAPKMLRDRLDKPGIIITPGVYDCLSAKLVERAGFEVVAVSGAALTASLIGVPDLGLLTMTEMVDRVRSIVDSVSIPVMADGETGFGGILNVMRTVHLLERAGIAGYFIEDQVQTRRCGHFANKSVIPVDEMVLKIKAAVKARENPDLLIMARTDARQIEGLEGALTRARAYAEAGADSLFVEAPTSVEELAEVAESLKDLGIPLKANMAEGGVTPQQSASELEALGYKFAHFPGATQKVALKAVAGFLDELKAKGSIASYYPEKMASLDERSSVLGLDKFLSIESELLGETA